MDTNCENETDIIIALSREHTSTKAANVTKLSLLNKWRAPWKNRTARYISFFAHHSMMFYFRCSVYWWKRSVRF